MNYPGMLDWWEYPIALAMKAERLDRPIPRETQQTLFNHGIADMAATCARSHFGRHRQPNGMVIQVGGHGVDDGIVGVRLGTGASGEACVVLRLRSKALTMRSEEEQ